MYGGYIVLTPKAAARCIACRTPGFKGDYQSITVLTPTANGFPWLARQVGPSLFKVPGAPPNGNTTFTMVGLDIPQVVLHLDHQSRMLRVEVVDAASGKSWHRAVEVEYFGRNTTATGIFALPFDGVTTAGNKEYTVPNGTYVLKMTVLKALGDEANPAHTETWTSPSFTIARP